MASAHLDFPSELFPFRLVRRPFLTAHADVAYGRYAPQCEKQDGKDDHPCPGPLHGSAAIVLIPDALAYARWTASMNTWAPTRKNFPTSYTSIPTNVSTA